MKILIVGAGAIGCYFGARLLVTENQVTFMARNERLKHLSLNGLTINSICGDINIPHIPLISPELLVKKVPHYDVVLLAVKSHQLLSVLPFIKPYINTATLLVSLLNGVHQKQRLLEAGFLKHRICTGIANIIVAEKCIGDIYHTGVVPHLSLESMKGSDTIMEKAFDLFTTSLTQASIQFSVKADINRSLWQKYCFVAPWGTLASTLNLTIGEILDVTATAHRLKKLIVEYINIANAHHADLSETAAESILTALKRLPANSTTSLQRDITSGQCGEFDALCEYPYLYAQQHKMNTPILDYCFSILQKHNKKLG